MFDIGEYALGGKMNSKDLLNSNEYLDSTSCWEIHQHEVEIRTKQYSKSFYPDLFYLTVSQKLKTNQSIKPEKTHLSKRLKDFSGQNSPNYSHQI